MKMKHYLPAMALALAFAACSDDYDDSALWDAVNGNTERIEALEAWQEQVNSNIEALQQLLNTMDYITSVTPVMQDGEEIGYTISFLHSDPITVYHGMKGADGQTPIIGAKEENGIYYWTVNGEWLLGDDGQKMPVTGKDGADGEDGEDGTDGDDAIAPQVRINEKNGEWEISTDGGASWKSTGIKAAGEDGDSFFEDVDDSNDDYVIFTLEDGTKLTIPKYKGTLTFALGSNELTDLTKPIDLVKGDLTYDAPKGMQISARILEGEGWSATAANGTITITGVIGGKALLEVTLTENGRVVETYRLTVEQGGLRGSGSRKDPYKVSSPSELVYIAEQVNNSTDQRPYNGKYIQLTQDIDMTGVEWTPIGYFKEGTPPDIVSISFCGTFDGDNHAIKGLNIQHDSDNSAQALFGNVNSGTIKDLTIESPIISGGDFVAAIVGVMWYGTIENCRVTGGTLNSKARAGGIAASLFDGNIENCGVEGTTITAGSQGGGIVACMEDSFDDGADGASVVASHFNGTVTAGEFAGGIVAQLYKYNYDVSVEACYSSGSISGNTKDGGSYISTGGIVGRLEAGSVSVCYSTAELSGKGTNGGVIGLWMSEGSYGEGSVKECYWSSATSGLYGIGAKGGASATTGATNENAQQVTGTNWSSAMAAMNAALTGWQYATNTGSDAEAFPLIIQPAN